MVDFEIPNHEEDGMKYVVLLTVLSSALACAGLAQSSDSERSQNLRNCLDGIGPCDASLLTTAQARQIASLQHDRNLSWCLTGEGGCNHSLLTPTEAKQVAETQR